MLLLAPPLPPPLATLYTAISCEPRLALTDEPLPVWPLSSSVQDHVPAPRPGTSAKLTERVWAPFGATRATTTPSDKGPAQYGYSCPLTGLAWPDGVKVVAALPRESWLTARRPYGGRLVSL